MSGHRHDECRKPWFFMRRYRHRFWLCDCGRVWVAKRYTCGYGGIWGWEEHTAPSQMETPALPSDDPTPR